MTSPEADEEEFHTCHFCGDLVKDGKDAKGERHWLSDCRPDLVEHEIGDTCTWAYKRAQMGRENETCYAYQDRDTNKWTNEHKHFYKDGPM
jgi:hypothetical protein